MTQVETERTAESASTDRTNGERLTAIAQHVQQKRVCRFYTKKYCRFGAEGEGCKFAHSRKCVKYITHGTKGNRGCKKRCKL